MTAATVHGAERPALKLVLLGDEGQEIEVKLTYGLFNDLQRMIPDPTALIDTIVADAYTRDYIIRRVLTPSKKMITKPDEELIAVEDIAVNDPDQLDRLMQWVAGHMLYFFAISAGGLKRLGEAFKEKLDPVAAQLVPSTTGSPS